MLGSCRSVSLATFGSRPEGVVRERSSNPSFDDAMVDRLATGTERMEGSVKKIPQILAWRDRLVRELRTLKSGNPHP